MDSRCDVTLYWGTRGNGKTEVQLMDFRRNVGIGYGPYWRGVLFDLEYKNLGDIVARSRKLFPLFDDGAEWKASTSEYKWVWPSGEELLFRAASKVSDYDDYHGHEYPWIGWNELTKHQESKLFYKMFSCNRTSFTLEKDAPKGSNIPPLKPRVSATTNPHGKGHGWVKRDFIDAAPAGEVLRKKIVVEVGEEKLEFTKSQVAIFGHWKENPYLPADYPATLVTAANGDKSLSTLR